MIPEARQPAVHRALQAAFGVEEYEDIRPLNGGLSSALVFRILVNNQPYLLKFLRAEVLSDPRNEFSSMQTAAEAGLAPRVWYASAEERVLISDYLVARPFPEDMAARVAATIRRIHALPNFPRTANYLQVVDRFNTRFQSANLLPQSETEELFRRYAEVQRVYPWREGELVASHNDLKPQNMIFDGERVWLVDWESAFVNDRYADLSIAANFFVEDEAQEESYLQAYFGEPAGEYRRARFFLMRQAVSMFYTTMLLLLAAQAGQRIDADQPLPDFRAYHQELIAGKVDMLTAEAKVVYGKLHLREALRNMRTERFAESVARVGSGS